MEDVLLVLACLAGGLITFVFVALHHRRLKLQIEWYEYKNEELDYLARKREPEKYS